MISLELLTYCSAQNYCQAVIPTITILNTVSFSAKGTFTSSTERIKIKKIKSGEITLLYKRKADSTAQLTTTAQRNNIIVISFILLDFFLQLMNDKSFDSQ